MGLDSPGEEGEDRERKNREGSIEVVDSCSNLLFLDTNSSGERKKD